MEEGTAPLSVPNGCVRQRDLQAQPDTVSAQVACLQAELRYTRAVLERLRHSLIYRSMRRLHLWSWLAPVVEGPAGSPELTEPAAERGPLRRIAVDLTPMLPGGDNGGAKWMVIELLRHLARSAPECEFLLLTSPRSHDELSVLEASNVKRYCVGLTGSGFGGIPARLTGVIAPLLGKIAPAPVLGRLERWLATFPRRHHGGLLRRLEVDLLFCPFTAPFFFEPGIPTVSVVYDLQYRDYPQFFDETERAIRDRTLRQACLLASRLVCISDFVRERVLQEGLVPPERVETIHITLPRRLSRPSSDTVRKILAQYRLKPEQYLLYPANFWPHKNHELLLTVFAMYRARRPEGQLRLVLTGAPGARMEFVREACRRMGLSEHVVCPGFLPEEHFAALLYGCRGLIFPSLYEGFGMPLLEAMAAGKPVLASNLTSIPEVAGQAAALFDPRKPREILACIERLETDSAWTAELVRRGSARLLELGDETAMAAKYWNLFQRVHAGSVEGHTAMFGVHPDGWTGAHAVVRFATGAEGRRLVLTLRAPGWLPLPGVKLDIQAKAPGSQDGGESLFLARGETRVLERLLPTVGGQVRISVSPTFQPKAYGHGQDARWLGCRVVSAEIHYPDGQIQPLEFIAYGA